MGHVIGAKNFAFASCNVLLEISGTQWCLVVN